MVMANKYLCSIMAVCGMTMLTGCAASPDGKYTVGDMVNEVARAVLLPQSQSTANTQNKPTEIGAYIKPMLEGCSTIDLDELIQQQKAAIANVQRKGNPNIEGQDVITTVTFKNAVAFGYPLQKIEGLRGYEWGHTKLYFNTDKFVELRPAFKPPAYDSDFPLIRNDANGYQYGEGGYSTVLTFDRQNRTILCEV